MQHCAIKICSLGPFNTPIRNYYTRSLQTVQNFSNIWMTWFWIEFIMKYAHIVKTNPNVLPITALDSKGTQTQQTLEDNFLSYFSSWKVGFLCKLDKKASMLLEYLNLKFQVTARSRVHVHSGAPAHSGAHIHLKAHTHSRQMLIQGHKLILG